MASVLPAGYNPPSVFTQTSTEFSQPIIDGGSKILAIIGVSDETKSASAIEVIRGSSSTLDNPIYAEDLSNQVLGTNATFYVEHFPVVDGSGKGRTSKDPSSVTVYVNGEMVNVIALVGATGAVTIQTAPMPGDQVTADYYFKKKDTYVAGEDLSIAVPVAAKVSGLLLNAAGDALLNLSLTNPGTSGNYVVDPTDASSYLGVCIQFTNSGLDDYQAVRQNGTDKLKVDLKKGDGTYRTAAELAHLINTYAFAKTGGFLKASVTGTPTTVCDATSVSSSWVGFEGGLGQSSAVMFKVANLPIVDGTDGGITTTDPSKIEVYVNGVRASVSSIDGAHGLFTLSSVVAEGASLKVSYYTNTYRDTSDELPNKDVLSVQQCGYSVKGLDFIPDVNFVLDQDMINWGSSVKAFPASTSSDATPFGSNLALTQLVDNQVFLVQAAGAADGQNVIFALPAAPVTGSGKGITSDNPLHVTVYVGTNPTTAFTSGPVDVVRLTGSVSQIMLKTPPAVGKSVYASYYESRLTDAAYTLTSVMPGPAEVGAYSVVSSLGTVPSYTVTYVNVSASEIGLTGLVFPHAQSDIMGIPSKSPAEEITLTFTSATSFKVTSSRTQAQANADGLGRTGGATTPASGSADMGVVGATGYLNQTYIDSTTGVQFTILNAASGVDLTPFGYPEAVSLHYDFAAGDQVTITCTLNASLVTGSDHARTEIPGVKLVVKNTLGVSAGDTGTVQTYAKTGDEPNIGDVYYVSYLYAKPASAYDLQVYYSTQEDKVYSAYGYPSATNKLALAAWIAFRNGAKVIGLLQVKKDPGLNEANDAKYAMALAQLQTLYAGMSRKPQIIVPLNTSLNFLPYLKKHVETQSSMKMRGECVGFFGYANNTNPSTVITTCTSMASERMVSVYPDGGIVTLSDSFGNSTDLVVDGSFAAVAVASLFADPQWDTATPRTRKSITGFKRLFRRLDPNVMNSVAQAGCTLLEQVGSTFRLRHAITTDPSNVLSVQPSITFLKDEIQQDIRDLLEPYIGHKFLNSVLTDMRNDLVAYFKSKVDSELLQTYSDIVVARDDSDPRIARVKSAYVPVGELTYVFVDLLIRSRADQ